MPDDPKVDPEREPWQPPVVPVADNQESLFDPTTFLRKPTPEEMEGAKAMARDFVRWRDAEKDPNHRMLRLGRNAACICGWVGGGADGDSWSDHFSAVHK